MPLCAGASGVSGHLECPNHSALHRHELMRQLFHTVRASAKRLPTRRAHRPNEPDLSAFSDPYGPTSGTGAAERSTPRFSRWLRYRAVPHRHVARQPPARAPSVRSRPAFARLGQRPYPMLLLGPVGSVPDHGELAVGCAAFLTSRHHSHLQVKLTGKSATPRCWDPVCLPTLVPTLPLVRLPGPSGGCRAASNVC